MKNIRPENLIDFYKSGHYKQYPEGTELVYSNSTPRSMKRFPVPNVDGVIFFGLQGVIKTLLIDLWNDNFFAKPVDEVVSRYARRMDTALGAGAVGVEHIAALHKLGFLPIHIKALPEGSHVPTRIPCFTLYNTRKEFGWLTNYLETQISAETWKSIVAATIAYEYRKLFLKYAKLTGSPESFTLWQGHDFSFRGLSGIHDAIKTGAAHLTSFLGTDTVPSLDYLEDVYRGGETFLGGSVAATEHSVMTAGGKATELETYGRLMDLYPSGVLSIVSDTWDYWNVLTVTAPALKEKILARRPDANGLGKVVFRPDSGDPADIICGTVEAFGVGITPAEKGSIECLWETFGGTTTPEGFKVLNERVGLIYGDSITYERANDILARLMTKGFASCNIVFGVGSYTYQYVTRDSIGNAMKGTYAEIKGEGRAMSKDPKTDDGTKRSATGLLRVEIDFHGNYTLHENQTWEQEAGGALRTVFVDGQLHPAGNESIATIRERVESSMLPRFLTEDPDHGITEAA